MSNFATDLRLAGRRLAQRPGVSVVAIVTLALGLGVNTAIFTIGKALMAQQLPVRAPGELYRLGDNSNCCVNTGLQGDYSLFSYPLYVHLRDNVPEFRMLTAFQANVGQIGIRRQGTDVTDSVPGQYVAGNYFTTLGVAPAAGRLLEVADDAAGAAPVFVISERVWKTRYGGDPSVVGDTFLVGGTPMTLAGITGGGFYGDTMRPDPAGVWIPLAQERAVRAAASIVDRADSDWLYAIGRLAPGATPASAQARATTVLRQWLGQQAFVDRAEHERLAEQHVKVVSAAGGVGILRNTYERPLAILFGMSVLVLVITVANLANLLLARADRGQAAIQVALGASPRRIAGHSLAEGLLLAGAGGALGLVVSVVATKAMVSLVFPGAGFLPMQLTPDVAVLAFSLGLALAAAALFSAAPAAAMAGADPMDALRGVGRSGEARSFVPRRTLVVVQVALSMILLTGAGLLSESLRRLENQPRGFEAEGIMTTRVTPPVLGDVSRVAATYDRLVEELRGIPGVADATFALYTPMESNNWSTTVSVAGRPADPQRPDTTSWNRVGPGYFRMLGTRVLRGRDFGPADMQGGRGVAIVNETFVKRFLDGSDPIGRRAGLGGPSRANDLEIIGVVEDVKYISVADPTRPMLFIPAMQIVDYAEAGARSVQTRSLASLRSLVLKVDGQPSDLEPALRQVLAKVHPDFSLVRLMTLEQQVGQNFRTNRLLARLTTTFGLLALLLAMLGVYGVTSYQVSRRTRDIGVRMALGANRAQIVRSIIRAAVVQAAIGIAVGGAFAFYAAKFVGSFLYEIEARDPVVTAAAVAVLLASAVASAGLPARRASRIEPTQALRAE